MNFAPYQDEPPEGDRATSPQPSHKNQNNDTTQARTNQKPPNNAAESRQEHLPSPEDFENNISVPRGGFGNGMGADERNMDVYSTSLPIRLDFEACLAYLLLPPAGGAILLLFEHKSDYVRFHAWQSSLVFTCLFLFHLIFSFTKVISFFLLALDLTLIAFLTLHAYRDAETLDRCELPWFGRVASNFVDAE
ncbi:MAG: hypothetical protein M1831_002666 [Alyxoria varia]|nr:MAG: hypothetical protein M1831_002666 [Alyxoria varia]